MPIFSVLATHSETWNTYKDYFTHPTANNTFFCPSDDDMTHFCSVFFFIIIFQQTWFHEFCLTQFWIENKFDGFSSECEGERERVQDGKWNTKRMWTRIFLNYLQDFFLLSDPTPNVEKKFRKCWTKTLTVYWIDWKFSVKSFLWLRQHHSQLLCCYFVSLFDLKFNEKKKAKFEIFHT